jgi:hypothetical protein
MFALGQKLKSSKRAHHVRFASESGHARTHSARSLRANPERAKSGLMHYSMGCLFDHLVGEQEERFGH